MILPLEDPAWRETVSHLSEAREQDGFRQVWQARLFFDFMELTELLLSRVGKLPKEP